MGGETFPKCKCQNQLPSYTPYLGALERPTIRRHVSRMSTQITHVTVLAVCRWITLLYHVMHLVKLFWFFGTITEFVQCVVEIITSNSWSPKMNLEKAVAPNPKLWTQLHSKTKVRTVNYNETVATSTAWSPFIERSESVTACQVNNHLTLFVWKNS
jgi:hypothetical protein